MGTKKRWPAKQQKVFDEQVAAYAAAHPGMSQQQIGEHFGMSQRGVSTLLRRAGVRVPASGRYAPPAVPPVQSHPSFPDYQMPEEVSWRTWFENFAQQQDLHKKIDPRQDVVTIDLRAARGDVMVVSSSDLHMGGGFTNHRAIEKTFRTILDTPGMYVWIAGDSIEGFVPGIGAGKMAETVEQQVGTLRAQISAYRSLVDDLTAAGKLLFCTWGDHDGKWFEQSIGFNILKPMIDRKVPFFNARGVVKLLVGEHTYYVLVNHGERFSSQYSHTHPQRRAYDQYFPADVIVAGHKHHPEWRVFWHYQQLREAGLPIGGKTILVANGTFKTGPDSYSCRYWEHGIMGVPTLVFQADRRDKHIFEGPDHAIAYTIGSRHLDNAQADLFCHD